MQLNHYKSRLERNTQEAPPAAIHGTPVRLAPNENKCEKDNEFRYCSLGSSIVEKVVYYVVR